jgi:oxygen-independent coproporphyrinogen-3 oxidase
MIGLPEQTLDSFSQSLESILKMRFNHLSLYMLQLEPATPFWTQYHKTGLPLDEVVADCYHHAQEICNQ